jgi:hypothetical protein
MILLINRFISKSGQIIFSKSPKIILAFRTLKSFLKEILDFLDELEELSKGVSRTEAGGLIIPKNNGETEK